MKKNLTHSCLIYITFWKENTERDRDQQEFLLSFYDLKLLNRNRTNMLHNCVYSFAKWIYTHLKMVFFTKIWTLLIIINFKVGVFFLFYEWRNIVVQYFRSHVSRRAIYILYILYNIFYAFLYANLRVHVKSCVWITFLV